MQMFSLYFEWCIIDCAQIDGLYHSVVCCDFHEKHFFEASISKESDVQSRMLSKQTKLILLIEKTGYLSMSKWSTASGVVPNLPRYHQLPNLSCVIRLLCVSGSQSEVESVITSGRRGGCLLKFLPTPWTPMFSAYSACLLRLFSFR